MPPLEQQNLYQRAVVWDATGTYDEAGRPKVSSSPQEIAVRWNWRRVSSVDPQGNVIALDAQAACCRRVKPQSRMWLGTLGDWLASGKDLADTEVMIVATERTQPDLKGRAVRYEVGLARFRTDPGQGGG